MSICHDWEADNATKIVRKNVRARFPGFGIVAPALSYLKYFLISTRVTWISVHLDARRPA